MRLRIISPKRFHEGTQQRVTHQVGRENLTVKSLAAEQQRERRVEYQVQQRIVNLRRMYRHATGRMFRREVNGPRQVTRAAVATAVEQTADPPEHVAQRDARRENVRHLPQTEPLPSR